MNKISIQSKNFLKKFAGLKKQIGIIFWIILFIILAFEFFVVKHSVDIVIQASKQSDTATKNQGVRIDFQSYNFVVDEIQKAQVFKTSPRVTQNPFKPK